MDKKIIVASVACDHGGYGPMIEASRETCYKEIPDNMSVYYLYGHRIGVNIGMCEYKVIEDNFYCDHAEVSTNMLFKTIEFYEWCLENLDFDYIYRTSGNCYYDLNLLNKSIEEDNIPSHGAYYGNGIFGHVGFACASGVGLLSKDLVELVVKQKHRLVASFFRCKGHKKIEDVAIGKFLNVEQGFEPKLFRKMVHIRYGQINEDTIDDVSIMYWFYRTNNPECFYKIYDIKKKRQNEHLQ